MSRRKRAETALAACLCALAGYVDALGFLSLGGFFVSFMSGNTTKFVVKAVQGQADASRPIALVGAFVLGAALGSLVGRVAGPRRPPAVLVAVALGLAFAGALHLGGLKFGAALAMAAAMGGQNAVFEGEQGISALTYVTGTLAKTGQQLVAMAFGEPKDSFVEHAALWLGLACGGTLGALAWGALQLNGLWAAAGAALVLSGAAFALGPAQG